MTKDYLNSLISDCSKAAQRLNEGLALPSDNSIIIDGVIQRFEFTFELSWKLMKSILEYEGLECRSPRSSIKEAFSTGLVEDGDGWIDMLEDRNKTTHIYDEFEAGQIYDKIRSKHYDLIIKFIESSSVKISGYRSE